MCDEDPTGTKLLPTGIPEEYSQKGSPYAENFLFGNAGLSSTDLNNKGIVVFQVVPSNGQSARRSYKARVYEGLVFCRVLAKIIQGAGYHC